MFRLFMADFMLVYFISCFSLHVCCVVPQSDNGNTMLVLAAQNSQDNFLNLLISKGADLNAKNKDGKTALHAAYCWNLDSIRLLVSKGANLEAVDNEGRTPFLLAVENAETSKAELLLELGCNKDALNKDGKNALMDAAKSASWGEGAMVKLLISKGFDPNAQDSDGKTALHVASENGCEDCCMELLRNDLVDHTLVNKDGKTAFDVAATPEFRAKMEWALTVVAAASWNLPDRVKALVVKGQDPNAQDSDGNTAIMKAIDNWNDDLVQVLLDLGADPNFKTNSGWTAILYAANLNRPSVLNLLIAKGADVTAVDSNVSDLNNISYLMTFHFAVLSYLILFYLIWSYLVLSYLIMSYHLPSLPPIWSAVFLCVP